MVQHKKHKSIVWVDEDTDVIGAVVRPLELAGHEVHRLHTVSDALTPEAIEMMRVADLILLDMILPPGDSHELHDRYTGIDVLRRLRTDYGITAPILVLSVVTNPDMRREVEALGVAGILRKPILPSELKRRALVLLGEDCPTP